MKLSSIIKSNLFGMPTTGREEWKLNRITLAFVGDIKKYENDFMSDY